MKIVTLCFPIKNNKISLANKKRGFGAGFLNGYGGKANDDEDIATTACRELGEEGNVSISPEDIDLVGVIDFYEEDKHLFECHVFFLKKWEGEFSETEEMSAPEEFPLNDLPFDRMWDSDKIWLPTLCLGEKIRAKAIYKKGMDEMDSFQKKPL